MRYAVTITVEAKDGIRDAFLYIHQRSPLNASRWLKGLYREIDTLEQFPERCTLAPECEYLKTELRQLRYKSHRILFQLDTRRRVVCVVYFRHARRWPLGAPPPKDDDD